MLLQKIFLSLKDKYSVSINEIDDLNADTVVTQNTILPGS